MCLKDIEGLVRYGMCVCVFQGSAVLRKSLVPQSRSEVLRRECVSGLWRVLGSWLATEEGLYVREYDGAPPAQPAVPL